MNRVILSDLLSFVGWIVARGLPFLTAVWFMNHVRDDRFVAGLVATTIVCGAWFVAMAFLTNTVPALLWRYNSKHTIRVVHKGGKEAYQIKLFGTWIYIYFRESGSYEMTVFDWWSAATFWWTYSSFEGRFTDFINAHRYERSAPNGTQQVYHNGERVK